MANSRIKGITIELDGDTKGLDKALKGVNQESGKLQSELKQVERALKFDPTNVELLRQKQELLTSSITQTSEKLNVLRTAQSQVQAQFERGDIGADQYRAFQRELIATEGQLQSLQRRLNDTGGSAEQTGRDFNELGESLEKTGNKMKSVGSSMTAGLTAPIAAAGVAAGLSAKQFEDATADIQNSLGLTGEEAKKLEGVARNVWENGFGESLEEVTDALVRVKQNVKGIADDAELERVTESALALAKTFDSDVNEVTRAGNNLMTNFGIDSKKAFDMMAKGAQNGLNFSNEMFDNLAEYAPLWADMGFSVEEMFGILESGAKHGVYNMDYLNDVMKEFGIRILDGSKSTSDAMAGMLAETQELFDAFQGGEVTSADMAKAIAADLATLENDVDRNAMGVALFGTKWEDLGGDVVLAMLTAGKGLEGFEGAMQGIVNVQEKTFGQRWESMTRNAAASLEPLGIILLDLAEQWLPKIIAVLQILANWFAKLSPVLQILIVAFGAVIAAIGPLLVVIGSVVSAIGTLIPMFASGGAVATGFGAVITALTGPIGIAVAAIVGLGIGIGVLVKHFSEDALPEVDRFGESLEGVSESTKKALDGFFELSDGVSSSMSTLSLTSAKVTSEVATDMISKFSNMNKQILDGMNKLHNDQMASMQEFFLNSSVLTDEHEANILKKTQDAHTQEIAGQEAKEERIKGILETAAEEKRALTEREQKVINEIQQSMQNKAVEVLSASEMEQKIIMERLKETASIISAQQAAEVVKNSAKQREETVKEAEGQYDQTIAEIIRMRDEAGVISEEQANKLIAEAKKQRDESVKYAEDMHADIITEAKAQAGEHVETVDWETGEILSKWQVFKKDFTKAWDETNKMIGEKVSSITLIVAKKFAEISSSVKEKMDEVKSTIDLKWKAVEALLDAIDLKQIGTDIIAGLIKGISGKFNDVKTKVDELASLIPEWAKKILGIRSPSRVMMEVGKWTGLGLVKGIDSTKSANEKVMKELGAVIINATKNNAAEVTKIATEAEKNRTEIQKSTASSIKSVEDKLAADISKIQKAASTKKRKTNKEDSAKILQLKKDAALKIQKLEEDSFKKLDSINDKAWANIVAKEGKLASERLAAIKQFVSDKKSTEELSLVDEAIIWEKSITSFREGTKERIEVQKSYKTAVDGINKEIVSINTNYQSQMQKINEDLKKNEEDLTKAYQDAFSNRVDAIRNSTGMFDEFVINNEKSGQDLLSNLQSQVDGLKIWRDTLASLWTKIDDQALMEELEALGPNAIGELQALNSLSAEELTRFTELYDEKFMLAREQATEELAGMKEDTELRIIEMREAANAELDILEMEWLSSIQSITQTTDTELSTLRQVGVNAGQGLLNGLSSMEAPLITKATQIANAISAAIQKALDIHSPSRVMRGFGINIGQGLIVGMDDMLAKVTSSSQRLSDAVSNVYGSLSASSKKSADSNSNYSTQTTSTVDNSKYMQPSVTIINQNPNTSPSDLARKALQAQRQWALEWGL